jgi:SAM-dependent methyltransferase
MQKTEMHATEQPSPWIERWAHLVPHAGTVLDVACGGGRHLRWFASRGHPGTGVDRDAQALATLQGVAETVTADIENGPWPFAGRQFDAVIVTNYLWRPLFPHLLASVAPGGLLLHETFAQGNETVGKPSRPDFLLAPGELLRAYGAELRVVAFEDGFLDSPPRFVQRIAAVREVPGPARARYML